MKKLVVLFGFLIILNTINSQDEYQKTPADIIVEQPEHTGTDSISVAPTVEETKKKKAKKASEMSEFEKNIRFGGGVILSSYYQQSLNTQLLYAGLSPQITYVLSDYFEAGIATSYSYLGSFGDVNSHSYSIGPIMRAYPFESVFLQIEGMIFKNNTSVKGYQDSHVTDINVYAGGGIMTRLSKTAYVITGIKLNLIKNAYTYNQIIPTPFTSIHFGLW